MEDMPYRDLQALAKSLGIAANQKKAVLIDAIVAIKGPICESPIVNVEVQDVEVAKPEPEEAKCASPMTKDSVRVDDCQEDIQESNDDTVSNLDEGFNGLRIDSNKCAIGFTGKHTYLGSPDLSTKSKCVETIMTPTDQIQNEFEDVCEDNVICNDENENGAIRNIKKLIATPKGVHTVFQSPELAIGNEVHWSYADYDVKVPPNTACKSTPSGMKSCQSPARATGTPATKGAARTPFTEKQKAQMDFWLSKGEKA